MRSDNPIAVGIVSCYRNAKDCSGWTALHSAALNGHMAMAQALLENGANVDAKDYNYGWTALRMAAPNGHRAVVQLLQKYGRNANAILKWATLQRCDIKNQASLEKKVDLKTKDCFVITGLRVAAADGNVTKLRKMLKNGANVNATDAGGWTALIAAVYNGHKGAA